MIIDHGRKAGKAMLKRPDTILIKSLANEAMLNVSGILNLITGKMPTEKASQRAQTQLTCWMFTQRPTVAGSHHTTRPARSS